jgi:nucleoside-diphosphate-sugar epimerase
VRYPRVLVTGTSGFIGSHLGAALAARGCRVIGVDRLDPAAPTQGVEHRRCDIREWEPLAAVMREVRPDAVLHLAARTDLDETRSLDGYSSNIAGVECLLAAMREAGTVRRAICTSSQLVCRIGHTPEHDQDYRPSTLYGESKVRTEQIWRQDGGAGAEWCLVRPTTIWGPRMNPHYLRFFQMIRDGRYFHVGGGPRRKSYGYVGNTVAQYLALLDAPAEAIHERVFYLADYEPIGLEAWAEAFRAALGAPPIRTLPLPLARLAAGIGDLVNLAGFRRFPFNSFRLNNVLTAYRVDLSSTRAVCGELPFTMQDGVAETVRWLRDVWAARPAPRPA